ncbi:hypothetical protein YC2023_039114 [Brassica napus]
MSLSLWWVVLSTSNMVSSPDNAAYRILGSSPEDFLTGVALSNSTVVEVVSSRRSSLSLINLFASEKAESDEPSTPTWRLCMGVTSPERHHEVAVTPLQSDLARATPRCRSRFHRSEARERPYSDVPQRHHKVAPAGSDVTGATQPGSSRRATRSDVSQRPLQVAPEAWRDLSERQLEVTARLLFARLHTYSLLKIVSKLKVDSLIDHLPSLVRNLITQGLIPIPMSSLLS